MKSIEDELKMLAISFLANRVKEVKPVAMFNFAPVTTLVLYREDQFQIEQIIIPHVEGFRIAGHMHPDIDSIELGFYGASHTEPLLFFSLRVNNRRPPLTYLYDKYPYVAIEHGVYHEDKHPVFKSGSSFFSVQYWLNGIKPSSIGLNWVGDYVSEKHKYENIQNRNN